MISVQMVGVDEYEVTVEAETETTHRVTMTSDVYKSLCDGTITHEYVLIQAFRFLLEREPNTAILASFNLTDISRYFPEFEQEIRQRLMRQ